MMTPPLLLRVRCAPVRVLLLTSLSLAFLLQLLPEASAFVPTTHTHPTHQQSLRRRLQRLQVPSSVHALAATRSKETEAAKSKTNEPSEDVNDNDDLLDDEAPVDQTRTLYDVLGALPTDTRAELKKHYVIMAKQSHPDALLSASSSSSTNSDNDDAATTTTTAVVVVDFNEVASAWRTLSDAKLRKRYDRSLVAAQFSESVTDLAAEWGKQAGPAAKMFERVAVPFIRRTTATTLASFQAAANDLSSKNNNNNNTTTSANNNNMKTAATQQQELNLDFSSAFQSAMAAAKRAGRYVDSMELAEKSQDLEQRAQQEFEQAAALQQQWQELEQRRLQMILHTAGSGLTSADAAVVLQDFNKTVTDVDVLTVWERLNMKTKIETEIGELRRQEIAFVERQSADAQAQREYQTNVLTRLKAQSNLTAAKKEEKQLRLALEVAQLAIFDSKQTLDDVMRNFTSVEQTSRKSRHETKRTTRLLERQSERVRNALREKELIVLEHKGLKKTDTVQDSDNEEENEAKLRELLDIRRQERELTEKSNQLEEMAARLVSRANKLKVRAEDLQKKNQ